MNKFDESVRVSVSKKIDENINHIIYEELLKMERLAEVKEYKEQIFDRRTGINSIFKDFNVNMELIEGISASKIDIEIKRKVMSYTRPLDRIISRRIQSTIDKNILNCIGEDNESSDIKANQVYDRKVRIMWLLENYDRNIEIFKYGIKTKENAIKSINMNSCCK